MTGNMTDDWAELFNKWTEVQAAKSLPERFKLVIDYNADCCEFVQRHRAELSQVICGPMRKAA